MHKKGKIEYWEDRLNWADFVSLVTNHKIQYNFAKFTKFLQHFFKTLSTNFGWDTKKCLRKKMTNVANKFCWVTLRLTQPRPTKERSLNFFLLYLHSENKNPWHSWLTSWDIAEQGILHYDWPRESSTMIYVNKL